MKKWAAIIPAIAAAGAAAVLIAKKNAGDSKTPAAKPEKKGITVAVKNAATSVYSFASGYKDAKTVNVSMTYDVDAYTYGQAEENFLCDSGDSHVGILTGDKFSVQVEYAQYYPGENFEMLKSSLAEKFKNIKPITVNGVDTVCFTNGWACCFTLPATAFDYVLVSALYTCSEKDREKEGPLNENKKLLALLENMSVKAE